MSSNGEAASQIMSQLASTEYAQVERVLHDQVSRETRRQGLIGHAAVAVGRALLIGVILGLWAYAAGRWIDTETVSDPLAVLNALYNLIETGRLWADLWQTVYEVLAGYFLGALAAVLLASLFAVFPAMEQAMRPILIAVYSIPKVALAPLIVMWFGLGVAPKIILAGGFVFFIVFMNVGRRHRERQPQSRQHRSRDGGGALHHSAQDRAADRDTVPVPRFAACDPRSDDRRGDRRIHFRQPRAWLSGLFGIE